MTERPHHPPLPYPTLSGAARVWARIAALSFGGPAGQIAAMDHVGVGRLACHVACYTDAAEKDQQFADCRRHA